MNLPFWLRHTHSYFFLKARPYPGVSADLMSLHSLHVVPDAGIPEDTLILSVPARPGEPQFNGISLERSVVVKNVKIGDGN